MKIMRKLNQVMRRPNHAQLTAVKMGHLQTTITKLITWPQVQDPSSPPPAIAPLQARVKCLTHTMKAVIVKPFIRIFAILMYILMYTNSLSRIW